MKAEDFLKKYETAESFLDKFDTKKETTDWTEDLAVGWQQQRNRFDTAFDVATAPFLGAYSKLRGVEPENILSGKKKMREAALKEASGGKEQSFGGKALSLVPQLPFLYSNIGLGPMETSAQFIDAGESLNKARAAGGIDLAGNILGLHFGPFGPNPLAKTITGAGVNAAQDTITNQIISSLADTKEAKETFAPSWEKAGLSALMGAGGGLVTGLSDRKSKSTISTEPPKVSPEERAKQLKVQQTEGTVRSTDELFDMDTGGSPLLRGGKEGGIPYNAEMRVDENGIPYRADLSEQMGIEQRFAGETKDMFDEPGIPLEPVRNKEAEIEVAWKEREASLPERAQARIEKEDTNDTLSNLETEPERVSKGQQRKMNQGMARGQRGALDFGELFKFDSEDTQKAIEKILHTKFIPDLPKGESIVQEGKNLPTQDKLLTTRKFLNYFEAGSIMKAAKTDSPVIRGISRIGQWAQNFSDMEIREKVLPQEDAFRKAPKSEIEMLKRVIETENKEKVGFSTEDLVAFGLSERSIQAYRRLRENQTKALDAMNRALRAMGEKEVSPEEFYSSHRWRGDFRQAFTDASKRKVWELAGTSKLDLNRQREALLKEFPDLVPGEVRTTGYGRSDLDNPLMLYRTMVKVLGEDDPAVARIKQWFENEYGSIEKATLAQTKHLKQKAGVRGYIGDRPGYDKAQDAIDFFKEQMTVQKNAYKWAALQEAGLEVKKILSDEDLRAKRPVDMAYATAYWKKQLGQDMSKEVKVVEDSLKQLGISPHEADRYLRGMKSYWIGSKLALSTGFGIMNVLQAANALPMLAHIAYKYKSNPIQGILGGLIGTMYLGVTHLGETSRFENISRGFQDAELPTAAMFRNMLGDDFWVKAKRYAEDNGVTSRSTADESPIDVSMSPTKMVADSAMKFTMTPEVFIRAFTFSAIANQLKEAKTGLSEMEIFKIAEEGANQTMGDYRAGERPMLFTKLGMVGDFASALSTFTFNIYHQWNWAMRETAKGNPYPALTMFLVQWSMAGAMGIPGFSDLDKVWKALTEWYAERDPKVWNWMKDKSPKDLALSLPYLGDTFLYGPLSTKTGISFTSRAQAPSIAESFAMPGSILADLGGQIGFVTNAASKQNFDQMSQDNRADTREAAMAAAMKVAPVFMQGILETGPFKNQLSEPRDGGISVYRRPEGKDAYVKRDVADETARKFALRTQKEAKESDIRSIELTRKAQVNKVRQSLTDKFYRQIKAGDVEGAKDSYKLYVDVVGEGIPEQVIINRALAEATTRDERMALKGTKIVELMRVIKQAQELRKGN